MVNLITDRKAAIKKIKYLIYTPKSDTQKFRKKIEDVFTVDNIPNNVEKINVLIDNISCEILTPDVFSQKRILLYIHGGSFVGGSPKSYRSFCASLANITSTKVFVPDYALAPENPFPKGFEQLKCVLNNLKELYKSKIILACDSTGASLALALLQNEILNDNFNTFSNVILFSPILNYSKDSIIFSVKKARDEVVSCEAIKRQGEVYTYEANLNNPLVSPFYCDKKLFDKFPPFYIQCGDYELFYPENLRFYEDLKLFGNKCELDVWKNMIHLFQLADEYLPESHLALEKLGKYIKSRIE